MYKIGEFSKMSKTTIKALRYYEKEGILKPAFIDQDTSYRYYESSQLVQISKIISLRQTGLSINDIRMVLDGYDMIEILKKRKQEIENNLINYNIELSKINYLLEGKNMKNEIFIKEIPSYTVYYCDGVISNFSKISEFVLQAGEECAKVNPDLKCITPDYCYVSYLDGEYKEKDIRIRYAQAVQKVGKETERMKKNVLKILSVILCLSLVCGCFAFSASAETEGTEPVTVSAENAAAPTRISVVMNGDAQTSRGITWYTKEKT